MRDEQSDVGVAGGGTNQSGLDMAVRHIAIFMPDVPNAEEYYQKIFGMGLVGREVLQKDGLWYSLPFDKNWQDAKAAGINPGMSALRRGSFVLALFQGQVTGGQVYVVGLEIPGDEIARVRARLPEGTIVMEAGEASLTFLVPFQITWQVSAPGSKFQTAGEYAGLWLEF